MRDAARITGAVLAGFVALIAVMTLFTFGLGQWVRETAGWTGKTQQISQTRGNGSYRIAAYDHFYDLCASVQDQEVTLEAQRAELATNPTEERRGQIEANIAALTANRGEQINHYNADARKNATSGQFRASDLPYQLDRTEEHTTCTA